MESHSKNSKSQQAPGQYVCSIGRPEIMARLRVCRNRAPTEEATAPETKKFHTYKFCLP